MIKLETYYDVGCDKCSKHRSTDFEKGMETSKKLLRHYAKKEGWTYNKQNDKTLCPECSKIK